MKSVLGAGLGTVGVTWYQVNVTGQRSPSITVVDRAEVQVPALDPRPLLSAFLMPIPRCPVGTSRNPMGSIHGKRSEGPKAADGRLECQS